MKIVAVILVITTVALLTYLCFLKKDLRYMKSQLDEYNDFNSKKILDISLIDRDIEGLAASINKHILVSNELRLEQENSKEELKRTVASISHDLRTPLTSIIGYIQMTRNSELEVNKRLEYLDIAERKGKDLQKLINDFFSLSVIESAEYRLELSYINLNNILINCIAELYESFDEVNISPNIDIPSEPVIVLAEEQAIKRVIENLLINTIKHSSGKVNIKILKEGIIEVSNEAKGISNREAQLLFERFYKGDKSRTSAKENTGLGLAIVKSLMEKMEGKVLAKVQEESLFISCVWKSK